MSRVPRTYNSESRQANAELTRKRILDAAKEIFTKKGFEEATIAAVAKQAEVSAPSIYGLFKSKEGLVRELVHATIFGAEYRALVENVLRNPDPIECLKTAAKITRLVCDAERNEIGFIRGAGVLSPALKALEQEGEQIRYDRQEVLVKRVYEAGIIRPEITYAELRDILWTFTSRDMYRMVVIERGWSPQAFEEWLTNLLIRTLVND